MQGPCTAQTVGLKISHPDSNEFIVGTALRQPFVRQNRSQQDENRNREHSEHGHMCEGEGWRRGPSWKVLSHSPAALLPFRSAPALKIRPVDLSTPTHAS